MEVNGSNRNVDKKEQCFDSEAECLVLTRLPYLKILHVLAVRFFFHSWYARDYITV